MQDLGKAAKVVMALTPEVLREVAGATKSWNIKNSEALVLKAQNCNPEG